MPDDSPKDQSTGESTGQGQSGPPKVPATVSQPASTSVASPDRTELFTRARTFLASPQVQLQDSDTKRVFLAEKGLTPSEVDQLLRESVRHDVCLYLHILTRLAASTCTTSHLPCATSFESSQSPRWRRPNTHLVNRHLCNCSPCILCMKQLQISL